MLRKFQKLPNVPNKVAVTADDFNRAHFTSGMTISACRRCGQLVAVTFNPDTLHFSEREHRCRRTPERSMEGVA